MNRKKIVRLLLSVIGLIGGVALTAATVTDGLAPRMELIFNCAYAIAMYGWIGAFDGWRSGVALALAGLVFASLSTFVVAIIGIVISIVILVRVFLRDAARGNAKTPDPALPPGCGLLATSISDVPCQLFRGKEHLYVVAVGDPYTTDVTRAIRAEEDFELSPGNAAIPFSDIRRIRITPDGKLRVHMRDDVRRFTARAPKNTEEIAAYLSGLKLDVRDIEEAKPLPAPLLKRLRDIFFALSVLGCLSAAAWVIFDLPFRLFAAICLTITLVAYALYCVFYRAYRHLMDRGGDVLVISGWPLAGIALFYRLHEDFSFDNAAQFILPTALLAAAAIAVFFVFNARRRPGDLIRRFIYILIFSAIFAGHINYLFDDGTRTLERTVEVEYTREQSEPETDDIFLLYLDLPEGSRTLKVSEEIYASTKKGDTVRLVTHTGLLGIAYSEVRLPDR